MTTDDRTPAPTLPPATQTERAALAVLDRRGRAAAAAVRAAARSQVGPEPDLLTWTERADRADPVPAGGAHGEPRVVRLGPGRRGPWRPAGAGSPRRRRLVALAAVLLAVGGAAGAVVVRSGGDEAGVADGGGPRYLVPGWLPAGFARTAVSEADETPLPGEVVVYGDASRADPWTGQLLRVTFADDAPLDLSGDETVIVDGRRARLLNRTPKLVEWAVDGGVLRVEGRSVARDVLLTAAAGASSDPAIAAGALPDGFTELARGPVRLGPPPDLDAYGGAGPGLVLEYTGDGDRAAGAVTVEQSPAPPGVVELIRFDRHDTRPTAVRGQAAVVGTYRAGTPASWTFVRWRDDASGLVATVSGYHVDEADVLRVAEGLRPGDADDLAGLDRERATAVAERAAADARSRAEIDRAVTGAPGVASGEHDGAPWTLFAVDRPNFSCPVPSDSAPCLVLSLGDHRALAQMWEHPGEPSPLSMGIALDARSVPIAVVGTVPANIPGRVTVELPGRAPVHPPTYDVPGTGRRAFVVVRPVDVAGEVVVRVEPDQLQDTGGTDLASYVLWLF